MIIVKYTISNLNTESICLESARNGDIIITNGLHKITIDRKSVPELLKALHLINESTKENGEVK